MLYAAGLALVQTDIKLLVAYASISHMNLIALGIFALNATGFDGSVLQMINHSRHHHRAVPGRGLHRCPYRDAISDRHWGIGARRPWLMWLFFVFILAGSTFRVLARSRVSF